MAKVGVRVYYENPFLQRVKDAAPELIGWDT